VVEKCLNGYRLKEKMPSNLGEFNTCRKSRNLRRRSDITLVFFWFDFKIVMEAAEILETVSIDAELLMCNPYCRFDKSRYLEKLK
jgi:hypothetical protein